jgi:predicted metal-dependent hydrolase
VLIFRLLRSVYDFGRFRLLQLELTFPRQFVIDRPIAKKGEISVSFVKNARSRRYIVRVVDEERIRVTIPRGGSRREAMAFFQRSIDWVDRRIEEMQRVGSLSTIPWSAGTKVWFRGREESIVIEKTGETGRIRIGDIEIQGDPVAGDLRELVEKAMRMAAQKELPERVEVFANQMSLRPSRVTIRGQRTRWGSCSAKGALSLNWRLMQVPLEVRDYVLIHELSHLQHLNHSSRFWQFVETFCPDYRLHEAWLRSHGDIITNR